MSVGPSAGVADTPVVFVNGPISTMEPGRPPAAAAVVEGDRIVAVGPADIAHRWPNAMTVDLAGRHLLPGFIDAHNHLSLAALEPRWADLAEVADLSGLARALAAQSDREPEADWIRGTRWELGHPLPLTRHDLDELDHTRPVIVAHFSYHQCVVSSRGLDELGISATTPDPDGGVIERDERGRPNGILRETAWSAAHARSLRGYDEPDRYGDLVVERADQLVREGITCIHDAACSRGALDVYRRLADDRRLPVSIVAMLRPDAVLDPLEAHHLDGVTTGDGDELVRVGPAKIFADGGAFPWVKAHREGQLHEDGWPLPDPMSQARTAADRGFPVGIHAMGNAGLDLALDAIEQADRERPGIAARSRIEHATLASADQIQRMASLGVTAVVQPGFVDTVGGRVHQQQFDDVTWMPFAGLIDAGVAIAASSDHPCAPSPPAVAVRSGVTRTTQDGIQVAPDEAVPLDRWLTAWTRGAAHAGGQLDERGTITPGKRADFVVAEVADDELRIDATWIGGRNVHHGVHQE